MKKIYLGKFTLLEDEYEGGVYLLTFPNESLSQALA